MSQSSDLFDQAQEMKLVFDPTWGWTTVLLIVAAMVAVVLTTYRGSIRHLPATSRRLLLGLRLAAVAVVAFAMLRPALQFTRVDSSSLSLVVISDSSRSMNTQDGPGGITRREALVKTLELSEPQLKELAEKFDVQRYDFDEQLRPAPADNLSATAEGNRTAIGSALESVLRNAEGRNLAGAFLLSDGAQRALAPNNIDPRTVARRYRDLQIPIHTVTYGVSEIEGSAFDLAVEDLVVDPYVFVKKIVPVSAKIRALGAGNRPITVRLLVEDRTTAGQDRPAAMRVPAAASGAVPSVRLQPSGNSDVIPVTLSFVPQQSGEFKIAIEAVPLDGELRTGNNRLETIITVESGGINVAYFDKLRPESKFIRAINGDRQIQVDLQPVLGGNARGWSQIDPTWFEPGRYDVYILGSVPATAFGDELLNKLAQRVDEGAGLLMTGGFQSFDPGGYARTRLADQLPVAMLNVPPQTVEEASPEFHFLRDLQMLPTEAGLNHYVMQIGSKDDSRGLWASLPPLEGANRLRPKNQLVEVLAESADGIPLLFAHEAGRARVAALAGDSTWLWYTSGHDDIHQRFWRQMILWLARKENDTDRQVWVRINPRNYTPGEPVDFTFGARTEEGLPITDADYTVEVITPGNERHEVSWQRRDDEQVAEFPETGQPGDYWVTVTARKDGAILGFDAVSRFLVDDRDLELNNPAADPILMEEIAALTGGLSLPPEGLESFLSRMLDAGLPNAEVTETSQITLWDHWGLMLVFIALMSVEWFARKRRGLV